VSAAEVVAGCGRSAGDGPIVFLSGYVAAALVGVWTLNNTGPYLHIDLWPVQSFHSAFRRDQHYTADRIGAIDRRRFRAAQHFNAFDALRVDGRERAIGDLDAVEVDLH